MAVMFISFGILLLAAIAGAYFAGVRSASSRSATVPTPTRSTTSVATTSRDTPTEEEAVPRPRLTAKIDSVVAEPPSEPASFTSKPEKIPGPFADSRSFERLKFEGTALATIYPREGLAHRQPIECIVNTRDLSRNGIGILHVDQLYPRQVIVLNAVGKLLVGEVRWCRRVSSDFYIAGCRLVKTIA